MSPADDKVEDEADDRPRHVVDRRRGRDPARAVEDDGEVDVAEERVRPAQADEVRPERADRADEEKVHEPVVDLPGRELPLRADHAPDDRRGPEHLRRRADEPVLLVGLAHVRDVLEHPRLHPELHGARDDSCDNLAEEHRAGAVDGM